MKSGIKKDLKRRIEPYQLIGMDTIPFIYYSENHPNYGELSTKIFELIMERLKLIITSTLSLGEALSKKDVLADKITVRKYEALFRDKSYVRAVPPDLRINKNAAKLRVKYRLKLPNAIQLATAKNENCSLFITNDEIFKRVKERDLDILLLKDFIP